MVIIRPRQEVLKQYKEALDKMKAFGRITLNDFYELDKKSVALLIEAAVQLGIGVEPDLIEKAGVVKVEELF